MFLKISEEIPEKRNYIPKKYLKNLLEEEFRLKNDILIIGCTWNKNEKETRQIRNVRI